MKLMSLGMAFGLVCIFVGVVTIFLAVWIRANLPDDTRNTATAANNHVENVVYGAANSNHAEIISNTEAGVITINGKTYTGNSVEVRGNVVYVDGVRADAKPNGEGILKVEITGSPTSVHCDAPVSITGDVLGNVSSGPATIGGSVKGNVNASVVNCGDVGGNVNASVVNRR